MLFISYSVSATEVNYSVGVTISKYDNLNLVQNPVQEETSESIIGTLSIVENTVNLVANLNASLRTTNYQNNQSDDENLGNLVANALWVISPGRYEWFVSDTFTQTLANTFSADTPNNRQNTNAFSTGPNFIWRINSRNNLNIEARAETTSFESSQTVTDADNNRVRIATSWEHQLQVASLLSLNYTTEAVNFDDEVSNTNFDRNDLFFRLIYQRGINTFEADAGITRLDIANTIDETRFRLSVLNTRTRTSTIQLEINRNLTDTASNLLNQPSGNTVNTGSEVSTADVFLDKTARIVYNKTLVSGSFNIDINKTINDYQQQNQLDQIEKGVLITGVWNVQRASQLSLTARYINSIYNNVSREDDDYLYSLLYTYSARRHITVGLQTTAQERESSDPINNYNDFRVILSLTYSTQ